MKRIKVSIDEKPLNRLASELEGERHDNQTIEARYKRAYADDKALASELDGWVDQATWPAD